MRCMLFFTVKLACVLSQKEVFVPFLPFLSVLFCGGPFNFACFS